MPADTIREVRLFSARSALSRPIADATHSIPEIRFVVAEIGLASGVTGQAHLLAFHYSPNAIRGACLDLDAFLRGRDGSDIAGILAAFEAEAEYFGQEGVQRWTAALASVALWDARGHARGQPVWRLLGGNARPIPVYGSGGWLSYDDRELLDEVRGYVRRGFPAVKVKVGSKDRERDVQRLAKVREAVGPGVRIMMDANQGLDFASARELAAATRGIGIDWFEEPLDHRDFDGYERLAREADVPLAMGEREYDLQPLRELARRNAIRLWQPDLFRLGGVERWRASAALAGQHAVPVLPHYYRDYDVALLCTIDNGAGAESFDWIDAIVDAPMRVEAGFAYPRESPGWGFRIRDDALTAL